MTFWQQWPKVTQKQILIFVKDFVQAVGSTIWQIIVCSSQSDPRAIDKDNSSICKEYYSK